MITDETFYGLVALAVFMPILFVSLYVAYRSPSYGYQPKVGQNRRRVQPQERRVQSQVPRVPSTGTAVRRSNSGGSAMRKPDPLVAEWYADDGSGPCSPPSNYHARDPLFHGTVDYALAAQQILEASRSIDTAHREHNSRHHEDTPPCRSNDSDGSGYSDSYSHSSSCHDSSSYDGGSSYDSGSCDSSSSD